MPQLVKVVFDAQPMAVAMVLPQPVGIGLNPFEAAPLPLSAGPTSPDSPLPVALVIAAHAWQFLVRELSLPIRARSRINAPRDVL